MNSAIEPAVARLRAYTPATAQLALPAATGGATASATVALKALARKVIERNAARNSDRNTPQNGATFAPLESRPVATPSAPPAAWTEGFASLAAWAPPPAVEAAAWARMTAGAARFLADWGAAASALGWTAGELFAFDPACPINRRDRRGAAFMIGDAAVVALDVDAITIRVGGALQRAYRQRGLGPPSWQSIPVDHQEEPR